jgi:HK97 family phage major capsid protein
MEEKTVEQLAAEFNAANDSFRKSIIEKIEAKADTSEIASLQKQLSELQNEQMKSLNEILIKQGLEIKKLTEKEKTQYKSSRQMIRESLESQKDMLGKMKAGEKLQVKLVGTMTSSNISGGNVPVEDRIPGLDIIATRQPLVLSLIGRATTTSNVISWVSQRNKDGGAGVTGENQKKTQADFDLVVANDSLVKITSFIKVSTEMLEDIDFMESEINNELMRLVELKIDDELLSGAGGANINGIITQATAYSAGTFAGTIIKANIKDVLETAITQVAVANFFPNVIMLNPVDITKMRLTKASDGQYIFPTVTLPTGIEVAGVRVVANNGLTAGKFLVMDSTQATAYFKKNITMNVGYENDDFTKNLVTILAEARLVLIIKTNKLPAFVYGDIATATAALKKAS